MDESWRTPIGSLLPRRRSTDQPRRGSGDGGDLDPNDFRDVFGGPPRTLLLRQFSGELRPSPVASLYDEVFRPSERGGGGKGGRRLPGLRIPRRAEAARILRTEEGFYDDIFGSDGAGGARRRSRSRSKSSSSVVSSEEVSPPLRHGPPTYGDGDAVLSSFVSKLRPITIPSRRYDSSTPSTISGGDRSSHRCMAIPCPRRSYVADFNNSSGGISNRRSNIGFCCFSPPETVSFRQSLKKPPWDAAAVSEADSPSSVISSVLNDRIPVKAAEVEEMVVDEMEEGDTEDNSFIIEIDCHRRRKEDSEGATAVDEAIAWAKEKFWNQMYKKVDAKDEQPPDSKDSIEI
ncbi:uncharacterized protein [Typha latifolia]|uniref:uncharacterized protein n=1 Tax=Typha latifolia TaxID=4733 RepID=UPI003C2CCB78